MPTPNTHDYYGILEVTTERVKLSPRAKNLSTRRNILRDVISLERKDVPLDFICVSIHPDPYELLDALKPVVDAQLIAVAAAKGEQEGTPCSAEHSYDGVILAISITVISDIPLFPDNHYPFRYCNAMLLAVRQGEVWWDPIRGITDEGELRRLARIVAENIRTQQQDMARSVRETPLEPGKRKKK